MAAPSRIRVGGQTLAAERVHPLSQLAAGGMRLDRFAIVTDPLTEVRQQVSQLVTLGFKQRLNATGGFIHLDERLLKATKGTIGWHPVASPRNALAVGGRLELKAQSDHQSGIAHQFAAK